MAEHRATGENDMVDLSVSSENVSAEAAPPMKKRMEKGEFSLSAMLDIYGAPLAEPYLWALLYQSTKAVQELIGCHATPRLQNLYITPDSTTVRDDGHTLFLSPPHTSLLTEGECQQFTAPDDEDRGSQSMEVLEKAHIYSLGATVWHAADFRLAEDEEPCLSVALTSLIESMTENESESRCDVDHVIKTCEANYKGPKNNASKDTVTDIEMERETDTETDTEMERETDTETDTEMERETDKATDRETDTSTDTDTAAMCASLVHEVAQMQNVLAKWVDAGAEEVKNSARTELGMCVWKRLAAEIAIGVPLRKTEGPRNRPPLLDAASMLRNNLLNEIKQGPKKLKSSSLRQLKPYVSQPTLRERLLDEVVLERKLNPVPVDSRKDFSPMRLQDMDVADGAAPKKKLTADDITLDLVIGPLADLKLGKADGDVTPTNGTVSNDWDKNEIVDGQRTPPAPAVVIGPDYTGAAQPLSPMIDNYICRKIPSPAPARPPPSASLASPQPEHAAGHSSHPHYDYNIDSTHLHSFAPKMKTVEMRLARRLADQPIGYQESELSAQDYLDDCTPLVALQRLAEGQWKDSRPESRRGRLGGRDLVPQPFGGQSFDGGHANTLPSKGAYGPFNTQTPEFKPRTSANYNSYMQQYSASGLGGGAKLPNGTFRTTYSEGRIGRRMTMSGMGGNELTPDNSGSVSLAPRGTWSGMAEPMTPIHSGLLSQSTWPREQSPGDQSTPALPDFDTVSEVDHAMDMAVSQSRAGRDRRRHRRYDPTARANERHQELWEPTWGLGDSPKCSDNMIGHGSHYVQPADRPAEEDNYDAESFDLLNQQSSQPKMVSIPLDELERLQQHSAQRASQERDHHRSLLHWPPLMYAPVAPNFVHKRPGYIRLHSGPTVRLDEARHIAQVQAKTVLEELQETNAKIHREVVGKRLCWACQRRTLGWLFGKGTTCYLCLQRICSDCMVTTCLGTAQDVVICSRCQAAVISIEGSRDMWQRGEVRL